MIYKNKYLHFVLNNKTIPQKKPKKKKNQQLIFNALMPKLVIEKK